MGVSDSNPILISIPESFETDRLIIRAPLWEDGAAVNEAVNESLEQLRPWMPWAQSLSTIEESEAGVRRSRLQFLERSDLRLHLILKETGQLIGCSGLHRINWEARKFEIGYWVRTSFSGRGYITEAVDGITDYAIHHLNANRIEIRCDSRNNRSSQVAQRLGFTLEGILRSEKCGVDGALRDTMIFSKVRGTEF
ncbi:GNAT family N-acetyltransferase [Paenibacillus radicis (ex Xue et al. 2023)]|uniref:GNAT family N-acetyltransferase n=1 Tax=Paenibacillus radicis (ex Xue et al. 2023) TaxID=2972489 RepID=A0ABT1YRW1_9BACL|nr:GNAT family N-acetyltransferase [Paenibacillus radicis (ex Xue et al. 2023)]MCR8635114.1 GNAT family N-acetyltransferase [Paenibacillus radicis (ex Xue et al. 2023)]